MDAEEVVVNLKVLGKVGKQQKIVTRDAYFNIEVKSIVPECVRRWKRGDDRNTTLLKINQLVKAAFKLLPDHPEIKTYMVGSVQGLANLKETYSTCSQTCARLDAVMDRLKSIEDDSHASVQYDV
jgi:hypothetical protein